jgi:TRAP transporter TAXI family solute receptor
MARALAQTLAGQSPRYNVDIVSTQGGIGSLESLQRGESDCGFSYANVAYEAYAGRLPNEPGPLKRLRGVALVQISPMYFIVKRQSPIARVSDVRGKTVAFGTRDTASYGAALLILNAFGIDVNAITVVDEAFVTAFRRLWEGGVDAVFLVAAQPSGPVARSLREGTKLLPLEGPAMDVLRERYPFLHPSLIPAETYPEQPRPLRTVGIESLLLCREDMPAADVRHVAEAWMATFAALVQKRQLTDGVSASVASATPIPLHAGASDYYRSRQVLQR